MLWGGCCVDSCSAAGPLGRALWRCIFGWLLAMPKLYHHYGPQGRRSWPQDDSNAAARQPTWRLTSDVRARCGRLSTRSVLNIHGELRLGRLELMNVSSCVRRRKSDTRPPAFSQRNVTLLAKFQKKHMMYCISMKRTNHPMPC